MQYAPKHKRNENKYQAKGSTENENTNLPAVKSEQMIGEPSLNFIRKIFNIMSHKQE